MVRNLHSRFDTLDEKLDHLAIDHKELKIRVDTVERDLLKGTAKLEKHEAEACLIQTALTTSHRELKDAFVEHANQEEEDRRKMFWVLVGVIIALIGGFGSTLLTLFVKFGGLG